MKDLFLWLILILALVILLALAAARANDAQTSRLYARAHLVDSQSSARQDLLAGMMPYAILGLAAISGVIAVVALVAGVVAVVAIWSSRPPSTPIREIERQTIILLQPGQTRRDFWRQVSEVRLLERQ